MRCYLGLLFAGVLLAQTPFRPYNGATSNAPAATPLAGPNYLPNRFAYIDANGLLEGFTANVLTNCILVNVSSAVCGSGGAFIWGNITGTLANQTDLATALAAKQASLGFTPENTAHKDANSGYAGLTSSGLLKIAECPVATSSAAGCLPSADWSTFNAKQAAISVTTTGDNCGAASLSTGTLNIPACDGAGGSPAVQNTGTSIGTAATLDFSPGAGLVTAISITDDVALIQESINTAVVETLAVAQSGAPLLCSSASGSTAAYTCSMTPTLDAYTSGMVLSWIPDENGAGGATTLNVDTLGAKGVKLVNGSSNPASTSIVAGQMYPIWYDGTVFRILTPSGASGGSGPFSANSGPTGTVAVTSGTDAQIYSVSGVPALATGACYRFEVAVDGNTATAGAKLYIDGAAVATFGSNGGGGYFRQWKYKYCNNAGSQTAQTMVQDYEGYAPDTGTNTGFTADAGGGAHGILFTPTAVNWAGSHTVAWYSNGSTSGTGNLIGAWFFIY